MKNIRNYALKTSVFMFTKDYEHLIHSLLPDFISRIEFTLEGIDYYTNDDFAGNMRTDDIDTIVNNALSAYFDTTVTSVHIDDYDTTGVWITYNN